MSQAYIGATSKILPELYDAEAVADAFYPARLCGDRINRLARRAASNMKIRRRAVAIDLARVPQHVLRSPHFHALEWCVSIIRSFSNVIPLDEVGYIGIAYNASLHANTLPNLACQAAMRTGISVDIRPEEFANYGCGGGFFPLETAITYCRLNRKAAIVITFEQCTGRTSFCYDSSDKMFKNDLKCNLLFSDGAAGILLIPEAFRGSFSGPLPLVQDTLSSFALSNEIRFEDTRFVLGGNVVEQVPSVASRSVIWPILQRNSIRVDEVEEWSIHQGGYEVIHRFAEPDILGLSAKQLAMSVETFEEHGNVSAASCFMVLDGFFRTGPAEASTLGIVVGFGAGYYLASMLYRWE
jgi:predicted naringenin-chalcone synthase